MENKYSHILPTYRTFDWFIFRCCTEMIACTAIAQIFATFIACQQCYIVMVYIQRYYFGISNHVIRIRCLIRCLCRMHVVIMLRNTFYSIRCLENKRTIRFFKKISWKVFNFDQYHFACTAFVDKLRMSCTMLNNIS